MPAVQSPFDDPLLYDWEYRRRRDDVRFYRTLAGERGGPVLNLGCGTGRLMLPLLRDGHVVVGVDRARPMLTRAAGPGGAPPRRAAPAGAAGPWRSAGAAFYKRKVFLRGGGVSHDPALRDGRASFCSSSAGRPPRSLLADGWRSTRSRRPVDSSSDAGPRRRRGSAIRGAAARRSTPRATSLDGPVLAMTFRYQPVAQRGKRARTRFIAPPTGSTPRNRSAAGPRGAQADRQLGLDLTAVRSTRTTRAASNTSIWHASSTATRGGTKERSNKSRRRGRRAAWA